MKLLALLVAASFPCLAFAEVLGARVPASFDAANLTGLFAVVSVGLMLVSDYSRRSSTRAFARAYRQATTETNRLAA